MTIQYFIMTLTFTVVQGVHFSCTFCDDSNITMYLPMDQVEYRELRGNGAHGTLHGGAALVAGQNGNALYMNGRDQWVNFGDVSATCLGNPDSCDKDGFTVMFWLQLGEKSSTMEHMYILTSGPPEYPGVSVYHMDGILGVELYTQNKMFLLEDLQYRTVDLQHVWTHMALLWYPSTGLVVYINGVPWSRLTESTTKYTPGTSHSFYIGRSFSEPDHMAEVYLDEFYLINSIVSDEYLRDYMTKSTAKPIRLTGGEQVNSGIVEIYHNGQWGAICRTYFRQKEADVTCHQLGYHNAKTYRWRQLLPQPAWIYTSPSHPTIFSCKGHEEVLSQCMMGYFPGHLSDTCQEGYNGVVCALEEEEESVGQVDSLELRLVGGGERDGRVEVFHDGLWGTVCDLGWDKRDATLMCENLFGSDDGILGYAIHNAYHGQGEGPVWMEFIGCTDEDSELEDCSFGSPNSDAQTWGNSACSHQEDASLLCADEESLEVRLAEEESGDGYLYGRVEVRLLGTVWGTICGISDWDDADAAVVCKQLGFTYGSTAGNLTGTGPIWLQGLSCTGSEGFLGECGSRWGDVDRQCHHYMDVAVRCFNEEHEQDSSGIRLMVDDGESDKAGRVEVYEDGVWVRVCSEGWGDTEATVVCRMLGHTTGFSSGSHVFGVSYGPVRFSGIRCHGDEHDLMDCELYWDAYECGYDRDAAVVCCNIESGDPRSSVSVTDDHLLGSGIVNVQDEHGDWGSICGDTWSDHNAHHVCNILGFHTGKKLGDFWLPSRYWEGMNPVHYSTSQCAVTSCSGDVFYCPAASSDCDLETYGLAGVQCFNHEVEECSARYDIIHRPAEKLWTDCMELAYLTGITEYECLNRACFLHANTISYHVDGTCWPRLCRAPYKLMLSANYDSQGWTIYQVEVVHDVCEWYPEMCTSAAASPHYEQDHTEIHILTGNDYIYHDSGAYYGDSDSSICLDIMACNDGHIALSATPIDQSHGHEDHDIYEIVIGGWSNSMSVIRNQKQGELLCAIEMLDVLDCDWHKAFWLSWYMEDSGRYLRFGRGGDIGHDSLCEWYDEHPYEVNYVAVATGWGAQGDFILSPPSGQSYEYEWPTIEYSSPVTYLPMDSLGEDLHGKLHGGALHVPGLIGNALYVSGYDQWMDFGDQSNKCIGYPDYCPEGFSVLFWMQLGHKADSGYKMYIMTSGPPGYPGIALYHQGGHMEVQVRTSTAEWKIANIYNTDYLKDIWTHWAIIWHPYWGLRLYINGGRWAESREPTSIYSDRKSHFFYIGRDDESGWDERSAEVFIDDAYFIEYYLDDHGLREYIDSQDHNGYNQPGYCFYDDSLAASMIVMVFLVVALTVSLISMCCAYRIKRRTLNRFTAVHPGTSHRPGTSQHPATHPVLSSLNMMPQMPMFMPSQEPVCLTASPPIKTSFPKRYP